MSSREERRWQHHRANKETREIRKQIKRNRKPKRVRGKRWVSEDGDNLDGWDALPSSERIMPRGERERRQTVEARIAAVLDGEDDAVDGNETGAGGGELAVEGMAGQHGIVVEVSSSLCRVVLNGRTVLCGIRGSLTVRDTGFTNVVAVGDRVVVSEDGSGRGAVEAVLPRKTILARHDVFYTHLQQIVVANADQLLIVASWRDPHLWPELVDRYLIAAQRNKLSPVICVNKVDLAEDKAVCHAELQPYKDLGYPVVFTSALTGEGIDELRSRLGDRTTVLVGMSGVGKSSLLNAIQPDFQIRIQEVSDGSHEGRHTTAQVSLKELEVGGFIVDTPGVREFGLSGLEQAELVRFYPEIAEVADQCRFTDCSHIHEPGCAVKRAVSAGHLSATRYHNYTCIYDSLPA